MRSGVRVIPFVMDVMGGISSQSVEFLQKLYALRKRRMAAARLSVAAQH